MKQELDAPIEKISRVSPLYQKRLKKLGIKTIRDLLFHFPRRYEDFSKIIPIADVKLNETCCIQGKILEIENRKTPIKRMVLTEAILQDNTGAIKVIWFNQPYLIKTLKEGNEVCLAGKVLLGTRGAYLSNPAYEKTGKGELLHTGGLVPIYPETEGLSSRWLRYVLRPTLAYFKDKIPEILPEEIRKREGLLPIQEAIWQIHFPDSKKQAQRAKERFSFEELFLIELLVLSEKIKTSKNKGFAVSVNLELIKRFVNSLPFKLTNAQRKCSWQILKDLEKPRPMSRLLQGDVGSGKTIVATIAALNVAKAGFQVAFMAPTEILAKQHFKRISQALKNFNLNIGLLTGREGKVFSAEEKKVIETSRKKILRDLRESKIDILIGTHALIQEKVKFRNLAFVILDEQHRFGIEQRAKLCQQSPVGKGQSPIPHLLSMTATPIPRTLALTVYGDLDLSLIDELPKGRKKVITKVIPPTNRKKAYDFIRNQVKRGRQAFVICPRIEPTNNKQGTTNNKKIWSWAEVKAAKEEYKKLSKKVFPDLKVGMLHGKMKTEEKEKIMRDFKDKKIDILVSTSVVEVGIDIPNATLMMIEGAERFGLSQLHQFRGRVGRSEYQSYCFLFTDSPAKKTHQRLKALIECENGFELAERDLKIRGPGDFFGKRQWGIPDLAMASLKDISLVEKTRKAAKEVLRKDPELKKYPALRERLKNFKKRIHLE